MIMKHNYEMGKKAKTAQTKTKRKEKKRQAKIKLWNKRSRLVDLAPAGFTVGLT